MNFRQICIWELDGEAGDIICDIVDIVEASMFFKDDKGCSYEGCVEQMPKSPCLLVDGEIKKPGQMISRGHKNYDLVPNLQLGIRYFLVFHF